MSVSLAFTPLLEPLSSSGPPWGLQGEARQRRELSSGAKQQHLHCPLAFSVQHCVQRRSSLQHLFQNILREMIMTTMLLQQFHAKQLSASLLSNSVTTQPSDVYLPESSNSFLSSASFSPVGLYQPYSFSVTLVGGNDECIFLFHGPNAHFYKIIQPKRKFRYHLFSVI